MVISKNNKGKIVILVLALVVLLLLLFQRILSKADPNIKIKIPQHFENPKHRVSVTLRGASLGKRLFEDPILSRHLTTSCSSCHKQVDSYSDRNMKVSIGDSNNKGPLNTPALLNLIWKERFFYDGRGKNLAETVENAIFNPNELNSDFDIILSRLNQNAHYLARFKDVYGNVKIDQQQVVNSITQYLATLNSSNTILDQFLQSKRELNKEQYLGTTLFISTCLTCHQDPAFTSLALKDKFPKAMSELIMQVPNNIHATTLRNLRYSAPYGKYGDYSELGKFLEKHSSEICNKKLKSIEKEQLLAFLDILTDSSYVLGHGY
ncbi:MAG: cytochrome-c peroxidase [Sphingobacterium hotanense]